MIKKIFFTLLITATIIALYANGFLRMHKAFAQNGNESKQEELKLELINDIKKQSEALKEKEEQLKRREERVKTLEVDMGQKISELKRLQARLDELITIRNDVEDKNILALSKTYSSMPAEDASPRLVAMNRKIALKILAEIKAKKASKILATMDTKTATEFTEQLAKRELK